MTEPSLFPPSLRSLVGLAAIAAVAGCTAFSLKLPARHRGPLKLEDGRFLELATGRLLPASVVVERLARSQVVFLGEIHNQPSQRAFQVALVKALATRRSGLALGLEFFSREDQPLLDKLAEGRLSEVAFWSRLRRSGGLPYKELLRLARKRRIKLVGLNLPRRVTNRVARGGWESLSPEERARWPRPGEVSPAYRRLVRKAYLEFKNYHGTAFQRFLTAQTMWDSTMAESIRRHLEAREPQPLVVVVGMMHVSYGLGIPARVAALTEASTVIVLPAEALEEEPEGAKGPIADYIWFPGRGTVATVSYLTGIL